MFRDQWNQHESRVEANTRRHVKSIIPARGQSHFLRPRLGGPTLSATGGEIHQAGHEIASHGYWHHLIYNQTPEEFRDDIRLSRKVLEDIVGVQVYIYGPKFFNYRTVALGPRDTRRRRFFNRFKHLSHLP